MCKAAYNITNANMNSRVCALYLMGLFPFSDIDPTNEYRNKFFTCKITQKKKTIV